MRLLVVEDDGPVARFIKKGLESEGYEVDLAVDGKDAIGLATAFSYDGILLDLGLPGIDGIRVLETLRAQKASVPVIVLSGRAGVEDRVKGLDAGADDYLTKPFSLAELLARVRSVMRRGSSLADATLVVADLELNRVERTVQRGGRRIELTTKEFALLEFLMRNTGRRVTRAMIIENVW